MITLDHVQLAMPRGEEDAAERFYAGVLGLTRVPKPAPLEARGGCWFVDPDSGAQVHLGVEDDFHAARKAHPAFVVDDLDALVSRAGTDAVRWDDELPGVRRCYLDDPFGNRIELIAAG